MFEMKIELFSWHSWDEFYVYVYVPGSSLLIFFLSARLCFSKKKVKKVLKKNPTALASNENLSLELLHHVL